MEGKHIVIGSIVVCLCVGVLYFVCKPHNPDGEKIFKDMVEVIKNADEVSQKSIEEIFEGEVTDQTLYELYIYLCEKNGYGESLDKYNAVEKNFYLLYEFYGETSNGGIEQFIYNDYEITKETLNTFQSLELKESYQYLYQALELYPNDRLEYYENQSLSEQLAQLDKKYYHLHDKEFNDMIIDYVNNHKNEFE